MTDMEPGFLRRARIRKASTRHTYKESWDAFIQFCVEYCLLAGHSCKFVSMNQLDQALERFAEHLFRTGGSKYVITCALQNCNIEYPAWPTSSRVNYPLCKAAKKGWGNIEPGSSKDPCPLEVAMWIAFDMLLRGQALFALAVVLGFDTYIRPGKVCALSHRNIIPPAKGLNLKYAKWTILLHPQELKEPSKTGSFNDSLIVSQPGREWVGTVLGKLYTQFRGEDTDKLFPFTQNQFEKEFKVSVCNLKLSKLHLTPHCLRHGGASHDYFVGNCTLLDVQQRGCWGSFESVRRYAKHGRISKQLNLLTVEQQRAAKQAVLELPRLFKQHAW